MARCGWCGTRGLDPNRAADDPNPHGAGNGVPCRGHATWLSRDVPKHVKGIRSKGLFLRA